MGREWKTWAGPWEILASDQGVKIKEGEEQKEEIKDKDKTKRQRSAGKSWSAALGVRGLVGSRLCSCLLSLY